VAGSLKGGFGWRKRNRERGRSLGLVGLDGDRGWEWNVAKPTRSVNTKKYNHCAADPTEPMWEAGPRGEWGEAEEMEEKETLKK